MHGMLYISLYKRHKNSLVDCICPLNATRWTHNQKESKNHFHGQICFEVSRTCCLVQIHCCLLTSTGSRGHGVRGRSFSSRVHMFHPVVPVVLSDVSLKPDLLNLGSAGPPTSWAAFITDAGGGVMTRLDTLCLSKPKDNKYTANLTGLHGTMVLISRKQQKAHKAQKTENKKQQ